MRNLSIMLALIALAVFSVSGGLLRLQNSFEERVEATGGTDTVDVDALYFWSITPAELQDNDPEGWAVFVAQTKVDGEIRAETRNDMHDWSLVQRHDIFLRRHGYTYTGE